MATKTNKTIKKSKEELKNICRERGLKVSGTKAELVERLEQDCAPRVGFESKESLIEKCREIGLKTSGNRIELLARLIEHDDPDLKYDGEEDDDGEDDEDDYEDDEDDEEFFAHHLSLSQLQKACEHLNMTKPKNKAGLITKLSSFDYTMLTKNELIAFGDLIDLDLEGTAKEMRLTIGDFFSGKVHSDEEFYSHQLHVDELKTACDQLGLSHVGSKRVLLERLSKFDYKKLTKKKLIEFGDAVDLDLRGSKSDIVETIEMFCS